MLLGLPDTLARWPWPRRINPCDDEASAESKAWFKSFRTITPAKQATFDRCKCGRLAALVYPDATKDELRSACDLMRLFYVIDEETDELDAARTQELANIVVDAIRNPENARPDGEPIVGEIARQFWVRASARATTVGKARFLDEWARYTSAVVEQSRDRDEGRIRTVDEYFPLRRYTMGLMPCYAFAMINSDLPLEVPDLPIFHHLRRCLTDIMILDHDMLSFPKEYTAGDLNHNVIPLVMHEQQIDIQSAISWLEAEHSRLVDEFFELWPKVSSLTFGPDAVGNAVAAYVDHLINWPRANECWSFENERYFGKDGLRIKQENRVVDLQVKDSKIIF
ncbi:terpenoid synthase [Trametes gibbosa]|nr:terpenoid synthase [Trametes gibbosa]